MTTFFIYFLEVTVCSALFLGYYWLVLRNSNFYRWNRFFINTSVILSIVIPLLNISIPTTTIVLLDIYDNVVNYIAVSSTVDTTTSVQSGITSISWATLCFMAYLLVTSILVVREFVSLVRVVRLKQHAERIQIKEFNLYCIDDNTAPFIFFRTLFWGKDISLDSSKGSCILRHELAHIRLGHSWDKALMQFVCCIFWMNPFFILLRHELELVHEFEADRESLGEGNVEELSSLILSTMYPNHYHDFTSRFFQSPIKRRIFMITKSKKSKLSIIRKISVIPILIITLFAFSVNSGKSVTFNSSNAVIENVTQDVSSKKYLIQDIKVTGAPNFDDFVLIGFSGLKVGEEITIPGDETTDAVNRFWKQGLFSDVKIVATRIEDDKAWAWLEIQLKPRPRIAEINYKGVNNNERTDLEEMLNLKKGHIITPHIVDRVKNIVKNYFDDKGYKNVNIHVVEKTYPKNDEEVIVDINIDKNAKI